MSSRRAWKKKITTLTIRCWCTLYKKAVSYDDDDDDESLSTIALIKRQIAQMCRIKYKIVSSVFRNGVLTLEQVAVWLV